MWAIVSRGPLDAALPPLSCHKAEFSEMLTYNTADDLPGPSRLHTFMHARRLSSTSNTETKAISVLFLATRLITLPVTSTCPERSGFRLHLRCRFKFVHLIGYVQKKNKQTKKKHSPRTPEDVGWHEAPCSGFSASGCARWRWREPSGSAPLLADAASGMLLKQGLTVRAFIPKERGGDAVH